MRFYAKNPNDLKTCPPPPFSQIIGSTSCALLNEDVNICWFVNTLISKAVSNLHTKSSEKARKKRGTELP